MSSSRKNRSRLPIQGKRSGAVILATGTGDDAKPSTGMHEFFEQVKSPDEKKKEESTTRVKSADSNNTNNTNAESKTTSARPARTPKSSVRLSLPGQTSSHSHSDADTNTNTNLAKSSKAQSASRHSLRSPSELSAVSTLPPTPAVDNDKDKDVDKDKAKDHLEEEIEVPRQQAALNNEELERPEEIDFPMATQEDDSDTGGDDDDMGDDLAPPVMDDEHEHDDNDGGLDEPVPPPPSPIQDDLNDNQDNNDETNGPRTSLGNDGDISDSADEGEATVDGPSLVDANVDDETETTAAVRKNKRKKKKRDSIDSDDKTPARKTKKRKNKHVLFSPKGIPIGNREYDRIPIVEPSPNDDGIGRRSRRTKRAPLEFWRNEKVEYGPADDDFLETIGDMPLPKAVVRAKDTPYRKRKEPARSKDVKTKKGKKQSKDEAEVDDDRPFNYTKLKRKYKDNLIEGQKAQVWDDASERVGDLHIVSYIDEMEAASLPLDPNRTKEEGNAVGSAAQAFNVPSDPSGNYSGYIMGNLLLPPRAIKDAESVGPCSQTFTVCTGQKKALEVAFADPDGPEGMLEPSTAQRFLLGPGDLFRVPPGNTYRLQNHSKTHPCLLTWTIIRPQKQILDSDQESP